MGTIALTDTVPGSTSDANANLNNNWSLIEGVVNGNIDAANLANECVGGPELTDDVVGAYRRVFQASAFSDALTSSLVYYFSARGDLLPEDTDNPSAPALVWLDDADYTMTGRTTKIRIRGEIMTNATAPGVTFTTGLYPVTPNGGGTNLLSVTLGTVVTGSTFVFNPGGTSAMSLVTTDINVPADNYYCFGLVPSGTMAANAAIGVSLQLQQRWT
jgi:hypothetical protein